VRALKEANKESVKAIVIDVPIGIQSYKLGYDLNVQRDSQTVFDNAVVWRRFLDDKHFQSQKELSEHLGLDESTVAVALSIGKLPESIMQEMVARPDRFGSNMAYQVGRYHNARGTEATLRLINKIVSDDLSTRQVSDIVKGRVAAQETPKPAGRQRYAQRLEIKLGGKSVGDLVRRRSHRTAPARPAEGEARRYPRATRADAVVGLTEPAGRASSRAARSPPDMRPRPRSVGDAAAGLRRPAIDSG
jgi:ParB family chromosome partitioning protein